MSAGNLPTCQIVGGHRPPLQLLLSWAPECANSTSSGRSWTDFFAVRFSLAQVNAVLLVLGADVFKEVAVRHQPQSRLDGEGPRVVLGVIEGDRELHGADIASGLALADVAG